MPPFLPFYYLCHINPQMIMELLRYYYHPYHASTTLRTGIGSIASTGLSNLWITDGSGNAIQHLQNLPFGEDWVDERSTSWNSRYTFTGKEKDTETGYHYFGARYYNSGLSIWLSVDPMSDKYPSMSPYNYCANNPVILVDPDGRIIKPYNEVSKTFMMKYLSKQFGNNNKLFYFNKYDELKINRREYRAYMKTASSDQKLLLNGFKAAIKSDKTLMVYINQNSNGFPVFENQSYYDDQGNYIPQSLDFNATLVGSGVTLKEAQSNYYYTLMNDQTANSEYCEAKSTKIGKDDVFTHQTGGEASNVFIHEVLDEFLNYFDKGKINDQSSSKKDKVYYQNAALRILGLKERTGNEHQ